MKAPRGIRSVLRLLATLVVVVTCLAFGWLRGAHLPWLGINRLLEELFATVHSSDLQWMVVACVSIYCFCFLWLNWQTSADRGWYCLLGLPLLAVGLLSYGRNYALGLATTDPLVFLFGLALFGGITFWHHSESKRARPFPIPAVLLGLVLLVFCLALLADKQMGQAFIYRGQHRWSGLWANPNMSGVLMAVGVVLAMGWAVLGVRCQVSGAKKAESGKRKSEILHWIQIILLAAAAVLCGIGLVRSYCRGAWLGAVCGLAYLVWSWLRRESHLTPALSPRPTGGEGESSAGASALHLSCRSCISWLAHNWLPVSAMVVSVLLIGFWNLRHTEHIPTRRIASAANVNDFSSRNRVAGWEGALQMAAEQPWLGFGWNRQDEVYEQLYQRAKIESFRAIRTNDYFKLANTLGIPALVCFVAFVGLSLMRSAELRVRNAETESDTSPRPSPQSGEGVSSRAPLAALERSAGERHASLALACRSGVVVLLVSFWFDGADSGLFRLASSSLFWVLLALGSVESEEGRKSRIENRSGMQPT